jgi:predicted transcriptional regulator
VKPPVTVRERVLEAVREEPGSTAADIAQEVVCATSTATRFATYWCERGMLVRQQMRGRDGLYRWSYRPTGR